MKRSSVITMGLLVIGLTVLGCASTSTTQSDAGWTTLIDGATGLDNWNRVGDANWRAEGGAIVADKGKGGFLVSKNSYKDFQIRAEFWADHTTNSGVFIRCTDPNKITATDAYEVNIFDQRPDPSYGTGGSSTWPRSRPCPKPAASGTPTRSPPRAGNSRLSSTARRQWMRRRTANSLAVRSACNTPPVW